MNIEEYKRTTNNTHINISFRLCFRGICNIIIIITQLMIEQKRREEKSQMSLCHWRHNLP